MTVLDAYALMAFLVDEKPTADIVEKELRDAHHPALVSAVNLAEVIDRSIRVAGASEPDVLNTVGLLLNDVLTVVVADEQVGQLSGLLRARHYHRLRSAVSLADCVAVATCMVRHEALATSDSALAGLARANAVDLLPLPDSQGQMP